MTGRYVIDDEATCTAVELVGANPDNVELHEWLKSIPSIGAELVLGGEAWAKVHIRRVHDVPTIETLVFDGHTFDKRYAQYLIEYLQQRFGETR